jgi:hypothetical protein
VLKRAIGDGNLALPRKAVPLYGTAIPKETANLKVGKVEAAFYDFIIFGSK